MKSISVLLIVLVARVFANEIEVVTQGEVFVNDKPMNQVSSIGYGDKIETKKGAAIRFKVGKEAFKVSEKSQFFLKKEKDTNVFELISGSVMGVFEKGKHELKTPNMTAGIRGTGIYAKVLEDKTYFCTCYGTTEIEVHYSTDAESITARHHNMVWVTSDEIKHTAHMEFHTDDELRALEKMQDRVPAFDR